MKKKTLNYYEFFEIFIVLCSDLQLKIAIQSATVPKGSTNQNLNYSLFSQTHEESP